MARFNLSFLVVFLVLAAFAFSAPTKRDQLSADKELGLENALDDLKSATKLMDGFDNKDDKKKNDEHSADSSDKDDKSSKDEKDQKETETSAEEKKVEEPTPTSKKPTSGNFVTPTATKTHHATSKPNALGKLPIVGGLLGGTGGGL